MSAALGADHDIWWHLVTAGAAPNTRRLLLGKGLRALTDGLVSIILPVYLLKVGFGALPSRPSRSLRLRRHEHGTRNGNSENPSSALYLLLAGDLLSISMFGSALLFGGSLNVACEVLLPLRFAMSYRRRRSTGLRAFARYRAIRRRARLGLFSKTETAACKRREWLLSGKLVMRTNGRRWRFSAVQS